jgi:acyl carrier protein
MTTLEEVRSVLADTLQLGEHAGDLGMDSRLLGSLPELDSMAVVAVIGALEERFGLTVHDDEIDAAVFESVGSVVRFVDRKLAGGP